MKWQFGNIQVFPHNYLFDFMRWRKFTVGLSIALVLLSLGVLFFKGLNYGIDFLGGTELQIRAPEGSLPRNLLLEKAKELNIPHLEITPYKSPFGESQDSYLIRIQREASEQATLTNDKALQWVQALQAQIGADKVIHMDSLTNISGKVGKEDEYKGYMALLLACVGILLYVAARFDARFAPGAVLCLVHNVIIALGVMTLIGRPFTTASIAAYLTIVGYTINDTVIVYDRIRETRMLQPRLDMVSVVNRSISQTMNRTVLTSVTGIVALLVLAIMGSGSIEDFALTMLIGIVVGTYSSIYVAAPLTLMMDRWFQKFGWKQSHTVVVTGSDSTEARTEVVTDQGGSADAPAVFIRKKP
jgi:preprotein translocase SecF subunit